MTKHGLPIAERLERLSTPEPNSGCLLFTGALTREGYGVIWSGPQGRMEYAHRMAYQAAVGPIPEGLTIDHLCRTPSCVNYRHLEAVSMLTNIQRGNGIGMRNSKKTTCPQGHVFDESNTYVYPNGRHRGCLTCIRDFSRHAWQSEIEKRASFEAQP